MFVLAHQAISRICKHYWSTTFNNSAPNTAKKLSIINGDGLVRGIEVTISHPQNTIHLWGFRSNQRSDWYKPSLITSPHFHTPLTGYHPNNKLIILVFCSWCSSYLFGMWPKWPVGGRGTLSTLPSPGKETKSLPWSIAFCSWLIRTGCRKISITIQAASQHVC